MSNIAVKLVSNGYEVPPAVNGNQEAEIQVMQLASDLFRRYAEQSRLLTGHLSPPDRRIQTFLDALSTTGVKINLPTNAINMDRYGMARKLSLPDDPNVNEFHNSENSSYKLCNGVLHNPFNDVPPKECFISQTMDCLYLPIRSRYLSLHMPSC